MEIKKQMSTGDALAFKAIDGSYRVLLCTSIYQKTSPHYYYFAALNYDDIIKPTVERIMESEFFGVGNTMNEYFKYAESKLEKMWSFYPEIKPYCIGSYGLLILKKDLSKFRHEFEYISNVPIVDNLDKHGNGSMNSSSWGFLQVFFSSDYGKSFTERGQRCFKVKAMIRD